MGNSFDSDCIIVFHSMLLWAMCFGVGHNVSQFVLNVLLSVLVLQLVWTSSYFFLVLGLDLKLPSSAPVPAPARLS